MATAASGQTANSPKLMAEVQAVLRLHHYAIRTERSYQAWIRRYVLFHRMKSRADLGDGAAKVEAFLTHLAVVDQVAASTQRQALNALTKLWAVSFRL